MTGDAEVGSWVVSQVGSWVASQVASESADVRQIARCEPDRGALGAATYLVTGWCRS